MLTFAGTSHHLAPLAVRERLTVGGADVPAALTTLKERFGAGSVLATCNRLEVYLVGTHPAADVRDFISSITAVEAPLVERYVEVRRDADAVRHLYSVAAGIDSMVLGEAEILGQVRGAFSATVQAGADHALLSRLFHTAIRTGRRARTETAIGRYALSVSSVAVQQARALTPGLERATVLVLGAGEAGRLAAAALAEHGVGAILVVNRTAERAEALAAELGGRALPFDQLGEALALADVVIAAADAPQPLIGADQAAAALAARDGAETLYIDIGVPRDVDAAVRGLPGARLLDLDDLQAIAAQHAAARAGEVERVQTIVDEETVRFLEWWDQLQVVPTISALTSMAEQVRRTEVDRTLDRLDLDPATRDRIEAMTRAIVKQLLHQPITALRQRGDREVYLDAARGLFSLDLPAPAASPSSTAPFGAASDLEA